MFNLILFNNTIFLLHSGISKISRLPVVRNIWLTCSNLMLASVYRYTYNKNENNSYNKINNKTFLNS